MANELLAKLQGGEVLLGVALSYPAPGIIELIYRGWDWVWIDMQHGQLSYDSMIEAVRTAKSVGVESVVRPDTHDRLLLGKYADAGPSGMMIPMVDTAEQAAAMVAALRFAPLGARSYGGRRMVDLYGRGYYRDCELFVMVQIETLLAVENAEAIIAAEGVDALFFGPADMKLRRGIPVECPVEECEELLEAMRTMADAARKVGKACGCIALNCDMLLRALDMGYQIVACGSEGGFMSAGASRANHELRAALAQWQERH